MSETKPHTRAERVERRYTAEERHERIDAMFNAARIALGFVLLLAVPYACASCIVPSAPRKDAKPFEERCVTACGSVGMLRSNAFDGVCECRRCP